MEWIHQFVDLFLHLDRHLNDAMQAHGTTWTYVVLFAIIFSETGFVVTPFLPGDSMLFAVGAVASLPGASLSLTVILLALIVAAVGGGALVILAVQRWIRNAAAGAAPVEDVREEDLRKVREELARRPLD